MRTIFLVTAMFSSNGSMEPSTMTEPKPSEIASPIIDS